jgi:hypothetical protein
MKKLSKFFLVPLLLVGTFFLLGKSNVLATVDEEISVFDSTYSDDWLDDYSTDGYSDLYTTTELDGGIIAGFGIVAFVFSGLFSLAMYVYTSLALSKIGEKLNYEKKWFAWVPILSSIMLLELGDQNPMLLFLLLIPGIGGLIVMVLSIIAIMNIAEKRGFDKMLGLLTLIPIANVIVIGYVAWKEPK